MKVVMMIKALILIHLWSLVVAGGTWVLQRDGDGRVGARFPASNIWLILIGLSILPGILCLLPFNSAINLSRIEALELFPIQVSDSPAKGSGPINYLAAYMGLSLLLIVRTLWRWFHLQRLPLEPTAESDIFTTTKELPPLTLSWPRRAVVIPLGVETQSALIRHERAHLHYNDAELTLLLLLLQDMMLRNPGVSYLVRQWRLSIELRADHTATNMLTAPERKEYASLLLSLQRPSRDGGTTLPCPTAWLGSTHHRNVKMRLGGILKNEPNARKRRWGAAVFLTSIAASGIGLLSAAATANNTGTKAGSNPDDYVLVDYIKKTPLQMPVNCPGLESDLKARGIKFEEKEVTVNGQLVSKYLMRLGTVVLGHDVRKDGSIYNARILSSTHPCFEAEAKAAIAQRLAAPQEFETKNVAIKLHFIMSADTRKELNSKLKDYLQ